MKGYLTSKRNGSVGLTYRCGWKFLRVAGLLSVAFMGIGGCVSGYRFYLAGYWIQPNLTTITATVWFTVMGMMLTQFLHPSKRVTRIMGGLACVGIAARIIFNYIHLGIFTFLQSVNIPWFYVVFLFVILVSVCLGAYIQNEFGAGFYRGRTVKGALISLITMIGLIMLIGSLSITSYKGQSELSAFASSSIHSFNILASIFIPLSAAVLFRSRAAYRMTRPLVVKFVLLLLALVPLTLVFETCDILTMIVFLSPYIIALAASAPTLVRRMVKDLEWF